MTAPPSDLDARLGDWKDRHDRVQAEVLALHHHRAIWREMREAILDKAGDLSGVFLEHYTALYVEAQSIRIRRLVRRGRNDRRSLAALVEGVGRNPSVVTRSRYIDRATSGDLGGRRSMFEDWDRQRASSEWMRLVGEGEQITAETVDGYLGKLDRSQVVAQHADAYVAHIGLPKDARSVATFGDLDEAIDEIASVHRTFGVLLGLGYLVQFEPAIQTDWKAPFRRGLFERSGPIDPGSAD